MTLVGAVLLAIGLVGEAVFIGLQLRVRWWDTAVGRNLMAKAVVITGLLGLSLLAYFLRVPPWIGLGGLALLDAVVWWRNLITWRLRHQSAGSGHHHDG